MALRGSLWPPHLTPPSQDGPTGLGLPLPVSPQLTGQVSLRGSFLPPDGKLINLELPVIRHVLVLIPNGLGLVLLEVLQGPKHPWARLRLEGLGAGTEVDWSVGVHMAQPVPHHSAMAQRVSGHAEHCRIPRLPPRCHGPARTAHGSRGLAWPAPPMQGLALSCLRVCPALPHPGHWASMAFLPPAPQALAAASHWLGPRETEAGPEAGAERCEIPKGTAPIPNCRNRG